MKIKLAIVIVIGILIVIGIIYAIRHSSNISADMENQKNLIEQSR